MAEVKYVSDQYTIRTPILVVDGNLTVQGSTTSVETVNSVITDNTVILNSGESGAGVTLGESGIEIERGSSSNAKFVFEESNTAFAAYLGGALTNIFSSDPTVNEHVATKSYVDTAAASGGGVASDDQVIYQTGGVFAGSDNFTYDGFNLSVGDTTINSGSIFSNSSNSDLEISANGTGTVLFRSVIKLENESSDPSGSAGFGKLYAKTPSAGNSGIYFSNTSNTDELVSRRKAVFYGLIL